MKRKRGPLQQSKYISCLAPLAAQYYLLIIFWEGYICIYTYIHTQKYSGAVPRIKKMAKVYINVQWGGSGKKGGPKEGRKEGCIL